MRELIYAVQLGCVLDLVFKDDATFRALPPKAVGREPAVNWALGLYLTGDTHVHAKSLVVTVLSVGVPPARDRSLLAVVRH